MKLGWIIYLDITFGGIRVALVIPGNCFQQLESPEISTQICTDGTELWLYCKF